VCMSRFMGNVLLFDFQLFYDAFVHYHYQDEHISLNHTNADDYQNFMLRDCQMTFLSQK
jgi:hypothetical protein